MLIFSISPVTSLSIVSTREKALLRLHAFEALSWLKSDLKTEWVDRELPFDKLRVNVIFNDPCVRKLLEAYFEIASYRLADGFAR